jgi:hypothetical protein
MELHDVLVPATHRAGRQLLANLLGNPPGRPHSDQEERATDDRHDRQTPHERDHRIMMADSPGRAPSACSVTTTARRDASIDRYRSTRDWVGRRAYRPLWVLNRAGRGCPRRRGSFAFSAALEVPFEGNDSLPSPTASSAMVSANRGECFRVGRFSRADGAPRRLTRWRRRGWTEVTPHDDPAVTLARLGVSHLLCGDGRCG